MTQILKQGIELGRADVVVSKPTSVKKRTPRGQTHATKGVGRRVGYWC